jgi:hypothetical protein
MKIAFHKSCRGMSVSDSYRANLRFVLDIDLADRICGGVVRDSHELGIDDEIGNVGRNKVGFVIFTGSTKGRL